MKRFDLQKLKITNFKGIQFFEIEFNDNIVSLCADNGVGKTTIADAFYWLFTDELANGTSNPDVRTRTTDGEIIHKLDAEVSATVEFEGIVTIYSKKLIEKWTTTRGDTKSNYGGLECKYYINDVPYKKGDFRTKINAIATLDKFKCLTLIDGFSRLDYKSRKEILQAIAGSISDVEIIAKNEDFKPIGDAFEIGKTIEEFTKETTARKKVAKNNKEQDITKISEQKRDMPLEEDYVALCESRDTIAKQIKEIDSDIANSKSDDAYTIKRNELSEEIKSIDTQIDEIETEKKRLLLSAKSDIEKSLLEAKTNRDSKINNSDSFSAKINSLTAVCVTKQSELDILADNYRTVSKMELSNNSTICECCGQDLPQEKITEIVNLFKSKKIDSLNTIKANGDKISEEINSINKEKLDCEIQLNGLIEPIRASNQAIKSLENQLNKQPTLLQAVESTAEYKKLSANREKLESEKRSLTPTSANINQPLIDERQTLANDFQITMDKIRTQENRHKKLERVKELEELERTHADTIASCELMEITITAFLKAKANEIGIRIADKFSLVTFSFFEEQVNGGEKEVCEILVNGVPFKSLLNTANRINAGLDIINAFSREWGVSLPVFIDNKESVNKTIKTDCQQINLVVSKDEQIRIS